MTLSNRVDTEAQMNPEEIHLWPNLCMQTFDRHRVIMHTDGKRSFPRGGSPAAAMLRIHSLLRWVPRNTTHFGCQRYCPLLVADLMMIGASSVMYTFEAPLGWGGEVKKEIKRTSSMDDG